MSGGGGGGVIIHPHAKAALTNPLVHGLLPDEKKALVDAIIDKDFGDLTHADKIILGHVFAWALVNLS